MNVTSPLFVLFAASSLLAQHAVESTAAPAAAPIQKVAPEDGPIGAPPLGHRTGVDAAEPTGPAASAGRAAALQRLGVVFDDAPGVAYAVSDGWKAAFDAQGATFTPFLGSDAPANAPVRFNLRDAGPGIVQRFGNVVRIERGSVSERYHVDERGIEQRFVFGALPTRGELRVAMDVVGDYAVAATADGLHFAQARGGFTYGHAIAFDAAGRRTDVAVEWSGHAITLVVPAAFVAEAQLPLTIDPLIGNPTTVATSTATVRSVDIAYDATLDQFVVCWERVFSATDSDVYVRRLDGALQIASSSLAIDVSPTSWSKCRIAGLNAYDSFLVVAECAAAGLPYIGGRLVGSASVAPPFVVQQGAVACWNPDVGGDPSLATPTYFTVVWEQDYSGTDHDIYGVQVTPVSTLRGPAMVLDNSARREHSPRISKSDGQGSATSQAWAVVWRRDNVAGTASATRACLLSWDGVLQTMALGGSTSATLTSYQAPATPGGLAVSSPTDAAHGRAFLIADTLLDATTQHPYLRGTVIDRTGAVLANDQQLSFPVAADFDPQLDSDGARFVATWRESWFYERLVHAVYDLDGTQVRRPAADYVTVSVAGEHSGGVVAKHSGGASSSAARQYAIAWNEDGSNTVFAQGYVGMGQGGFTTRATACGALSVSTAGVPAIGDTVNVTLGNVLGVAGWAFGDPIDVPLGACPGCRIGTSAYVLSIGSSLPIAIPWNPALVNVQFALQGFDIGGGSCFGSIALSDTIDMRVQ